MKRPRGSGSVIVRSDVYCGRWWVGGRHVMRGPGPVRPPGTRQGLTQTMAEARLRELMAEVLPPPAGERVTVQDAGRRHLGHLEAMGRKPSTLRSYRNQFDLVNEAFAMETDPASEAAASERQADCSV